MPLPLIPIAAGMAVGSSVIGISQGFRINKQKKIYEEARTNAEMTEQLVKSTERDFNKSIGEYGYTKAQASETLQQAAEFLRKAKVKNRDFYVGNPQEFTLRLEQLQLQAETFQTILRTVSGPAAAAGAYGAPVGVYNAVGLFGHAGTGTRIAGLSGAARHSAILANIGRMVGIGGAGMSAGAQALSAISFGLNIISLPISIGVTFWSVNKANKVKVQVGKAVSDLKSAEEKMAGQILTMQAVMRRMDEASRSVISSRYTLAKQLELAAYKPAGRLSWVKVTIQWIADQLSRIWSKLSGQTSARDILAQQHAHAVYELADLLGRAMDAEVITKEQAQILGIAINAPALEG